MRLNTAKPRRTGVYRQLGAIEGIPGADGWVFLFLRPKLKILKQLLFMRRLNTRKEKPQGGTDLAKMRDVPTTQLYYPEILLGIRRLY